MKAFCFSLSLSSEGRIIGRFRSKKPYETPVSPPTENTWRSSFLRGRGGVLGVWLAAYVCAVTWSQSKKGVNGDYSVFEIILSTLSPNFHLGRQQGTVTRLG